MKGIVRPVVPASRDTHEEYRDQADTQLVSKLQENPLVAQGARLTDEVTFTAGETKIVEHKLGRAFAGFFPVHTPAASSSYVAFRTLAETTSAPKDKFLYLQSQSACTLRFLVF